MCMLNKGKGFEYVKKLSDFFLGEKGTTGKINSGIFVKSLAILLEIYFVLCKLSC